MDTILSIFKIFILPEAVIPAIIIGVVTALIMNYVLKSEIKKKATFLGPNALHASSWWLVSGGQSPYYYDLDTVIQPVYGLKLISDWYIHTIQNIFKEMAY